MGKLDAGSQDVTTAVIDIAALDTGGDVVNGPEDLLDWEAIDWRDQERQVQRLRQRIFKATQAGDYLPHKYHRHSIDSCCSRSPRAV
jgi:RNA-directed DNA polymerase